MSQKVYQLVFVLVLSLCFVAAKSILLSSRELILLNEKQELKLPLDNDNLKLALSSGLVTNRPNEDKEIPFVFTPFGVFARECVVGVDGGSKVSDLKNGDLFVEKKDGTHWVYESSKYKCHERFEPLNVPNMKRMNRSNLAAPLWQDGWLDNAWYSDSNEFGEFYSNYIVPGTPRATGGILFWFIGLESSNSDLAILQPVLTWDNIVSGWSFVSWYCCPSGTPNYATDYITGFGTGANLHGVIQPDGAYGSDFNVSSCDSQRCSTLACPAQGRVFSAADVTLETYHITNCSEFAPGTMTFSNMLMKDIGGGVLTPGWYDATGPTECAGQINIVNSATVTITHA